MLPLDPCRWAMGRRISFAAGPCFHELLFANHRPRSQVFSLFDEECVTKPIVERPLQEIDCDDDPRLQPAAELHLVGCDPVVEFYTPFGSVLLKYSSRVAAFQALFRTG